LKPEKSFVIFFLCFFGGLTAFWAPFESLKLFNNDFPIGGVFFLKKKKKNKEKFLNSGGFGVFFLKCFCPEIWRPQPFFFPQKPFFPPPQTGRAVFNVLGAWGANFPVPKKALSGFRVGWGGGLSFSVLSFFLILGAQKKGGFFFFGSLEPPPGGAPPPPILKTPPPKGPGGGPGLFFFLRVFPQKKKKKMSPKKKLKKKKGKTIVKKNPKICFLPRGFSPLFFPFEKKKKKRGIKKFFFRGPRFLGNWVCRGFKNNGHF